MTTASNRAATGRTRRHPLDRARTLTAAALLTATLATGAVTVQLATSAGAATVTPADNGTDSGTDSGTSSGSGTSFGSVDTPSSGSGGSHSSTRAS